uniref:Uncharacterized protein n=1 Tax=Timema shepardi TaxID=629360 RepID=A0A7R9AR43_TIMSH|nr:unnamed protein product [Timema shepardi]
MRKEDVDHLGVVVLAPFLQHHLEGKLQRGRVAVVDVADHTVSLVFDLVHDTRDVHCSAPVNNTRNASFGGTFPSVQKMLVSDCFATSESTSLIVTEERLLCDNVPKSS